jgi:hypothetical protein
MILGIDPGISTTGLALVENVRLFKHKTLPGVEALSYIESMHRFYGFNRAVVEKPRAGVLYGRHLTKSNNVVNIRGMIKIAQNVGQNIQMTNQIIEKLKNLNVQVIDVNPKNKTTKWKKEFWQKVFQWKGRLPSEHARDAAVLALQWEKWVGWV